MPKIVPADLKAWAKLRPPNFWENIGLSGGGNPGETEIIIKWNKEEDHTPFFDKMMLEADKFMKWNDREREIEILCSQETFDLLHDLEIERTDFTAL